MTVVWGMLRVSALLGVLLLIACGDDGRVAPSDVPTADMGPVPSADGGDTGEGDAFVPTSPLVDPACVDGMYSEVLPAVDADISDLTWAGDVGAYVDAFLDRRYPVGAALVRGGRTNTDYGQDCDVLYAGSPSSAGDVIDRMNTIVHECGHFYDGELSTFTDNTYVVTPTQQISCSRGDATDRGGDYSCDSEERAEELRSLLYYHTTSV